MPRPIDGQMLGDISDHSPQAFALMVASAFIVYITKGPFDRVSLGTIRRQEQQLKAGLRGQPLRDRLGLVNLVVVHNHLEVGEQPGWISPVEGPKQVQKQALFFAPPHPRDDRSPIHIPCPSQGALVVGPRGQDFELLTFGHPLRADFGQQTESEFIGKEQRGPGRQRLAGVADARQLLHPLRVVIFGSQLGPLPYPAQFVQPAAHRFGRHWHAPADLQLQGQRRATPATGPRDSPQQGQQGTRESRRQDPHPRSLLALLGTVPWACGWSCAPLALELQVRRGVPVSAETVRRWLHELGWVWKRAKLAAKDDDPQRVEKLARIRYTCEPLPARAALFFTDELAISLLPKVGSQWMPKGEQLEVLTPGTNDKRSLAGAWDMDRGTIVPRVWWRKTQGLFLDLLGTLDRAYPPWLFTHL